ncbi:MAG: NosD domain-containing protein [Candidatus Bipolaricaulota bacterium]
MSKATLALLVVCAVLLPGAGEQISREAIVIRSDLEFTAENGVVSGAGLHGDPYVIEGWDIDAAGGSYGILIHGTTRPFVIRDVSIRGARKAGVRLTQTRDGRIRDVDIAGCTTGIYINMASHITLRELSIRQCEDGIRILFSSELKVDRVYIEHCQAGLWASGVTELVMQGSTVRSSNIGVRLELSSQENTVAENAFFDCRIPAYSEGGGNRFHLDERGNYWEGHDASIPYPVDGGEDEDPFPLVSPP